MVTQQCIVSLSELSAQVKVDTAYINFANMDVSSLLGEHCFQELCTALKTAVEAANAYNEDPGNTDKKCAEDFLASKWLAVIQNMYFKTWYANRVAWHWFEGSSITQIKKVGIITTSNDDEEFKNSFKHAAESQRKRLALTAERNASNAKKLFLDHFWNCVDPATYTCKPVCPCDEEDTTGKSIGMSPLR